MLIMSMLLVSPASYSGEVRVKTVGIDIGRGAWKSWPGLSAAAFASFAQAYCPRSSMLEERWPQQRQKKEMDGGRCGAPQLPRIRPLEEPQAYISIQHSRSYNRM